MLNARIVILVLVAVLTPAAAGPFLVGWVASQGSNTLMSALTALLCVGFGPLAGLLLLPWVIETRGRALAD